MNVFVTIWNRYSWAIPLCDDFTKAGLNVILIDNKTTYEPAVKWLKKCPYEVIYMNKNEGPWAFFTTGLYQEYKDRYFMISDSDQDISKVPSDFVDVLMGGLQEESDGVWKSGLSQEINDLPDNIFSNDIREYESGYWGNENRFGYYKVFMDLGIAVYDKSRRGVNPIKEENWYAAVRSKRPYTSRHLDWYLTPDTFREEDIYYLKDLAMTHQGWLYNWIKKYGYKL
jgi:hypothetical protein